MNKSRILKLDTCRDCPNHFTRESEHLLSHLHYCDLGDGVCEEIQDPSKVPAWCPLPSDSISELRAENEQLRILCRGTGKTLVAAGEGSDAR